MKCVGSRGGVGGGERVVDGAAGAAGALAADAARGVGLGVEVDEQDLLARQGEGGGQIDGRRGLADAAFLVGDGDDAHLW